jgi:ubiquitin-protein ligase
MPSPRIRARRLHAEYQRVRKLQDSSALIALEQVLGDPPDRYVVRYTCRGIARVVNDRPIYSELHRVALVLTSTYPTTQPLMEWLTPIFHPNIRPDGGEVCIGTWFPAKTLDQLLLMLGEMIQYRNYASHDPLYLEASLWAMAHKELFPVDERPLVGSLRAAGGSQRTHAGKSDLEIVILG